MLGVCSSYVCIEGVGIMNPSEIYIRSRQNGFESSITSRVENIMGPRLPIVGG